MEDPVPCVRCIRSGNARRLGLWFLVARRIIIRGNAIPAAIILQHLGISWLFGLETDQVRGFRNSGWEEPGYWKTSYIGCVLV